VDSDAAVVTRERRKKAPATLRCASARHGLVQRTHVVWRELLAVQDLLVVQPPPHRSTLCGLLTWQPVLTHESLQPPQSLLPRLLPLAHHLGLVVPTGQLRVQHALDLRVEAAA